MSFFCFGVEILFWSCKFLQFVEPLCVVLLRFATQCLQIAMEWLHQGFSLHAAAACEYNGFAAESRESHCNGSVRRVNGALEADFTRMRGKGFDILTTSKRKGFVASPIDTTKLEESQRLKRRHVGA